MNQITELMQSMDQMLQNMEFWLGVLAVLLLFAAFLVLRGGRNVASPAPATDAMLKAIGAESGIVLTDCAFSDNRANSLSNTPVPESLVARDLLTAGWVRAGERRRGCVRIVEWKDPFNGAIYTQKEAIAWERFRGKQSRGRRCVRAES